MYEQIQSPVTYRIKTSMHISSCYLQIYTSRLTLYKIEHVLILVKMSQITCGRK